MSASSAAREPAQAAATHAVCSDFHAAIELIGRRWNGVVLQQLLDGPQRFSELRDHIDGITDAMLSQRLKDLEAAGLITRDVGTCRPIEVHYELTAIGTQLAPVLQAVGNWAHRWAEHRDPPGANRSGSSQ